MASRLQQWGTYKHRGRNVRPQISAQTKNRIRQLFKDNRGISLRAVAETSVAHTAIRKFLGKELRSFPYNLQMATSLTEDNKMRKKSSPQCCRRELRNDRRYLEGIFFSNECKFSLPGSVNKQNCRIWASGRPNEVYETLENSPSIIVWCALSKKEKIGSYFFEDGNVTASRHKRMLQHFSFQASRLLRKQYLPTVWCGPNYANEVGEYLGWKLLARRMKRVLE